MQSKTLSVSSGEHEIEKLHAELEANISVRAPWYCYAIVLGSLSIIIGILWDISWHRSIGRDTFWTPAHLAIHFGGIMGGIVSGFLIIRSTFLRSQGGNDSVSTIAIGPLRAPAGAWVCLFGNLAMLTSAPFDDWWHNAYGLDVKILSPPHMVLALGMFSVVFGGLLLLARDWNNQGSGGIRRSPWLMVLGGGILLAMATTVLIEVSWPNEYRQKQFLTVSCATYPFYLLGIARATRWRWAGTVIGLIYMSLVAGMVWILPLFEAQPLLGPIYNPVDYFVPLPFPLLLVVPGLALDLVRWPFENKSGLWWGMALGVAGAITFTLTFYWTQYHFGTFLLSEKAHNWFFAADRHWGYQERVFGSDWQMQFWGKPVENIFAQPTIFLYALGACWFSLLAGNWLGKIRR